VTLLSSKEPYRQTDTQTRRAYKWLQVPPFNLTVIVGNDNYLIYNYFDYGLTSSLSNILSGFSINQNGECEFNYYFAFYFNH